MARCGVEIATWVRIDECGIEYRLCGDVVEFSLGGTSDGFQFDTTERGLELLLESGTQALHALRTAS
ncbi:hypothetical protein [Amycolatopsis samaneae]|uniref:Uncharacterized protein n=1 Tax=Amycolatopsis samaneae TaxID=664691 RepID=A0ABW5GA57_9PSEU